MHHQFELPGAKLGCWCVVGERITGPSCSQNVVLIIVSTPQCQVINGLERLMHRSTVYGLPIDLLPALTSGELGS